MAAHLRGRHPRPEVQGGRGRGRGDRGLRRSWGGRHCRPGGWGRAVQLRLVGEEAGRGCGTCQSVRVTSTPWTFPGASPQLPGCSVHGGPGRTPLLSLLQDQVDTLTFQSQSLRDRARRFEDALKRNAEDQLEVAEPARPPGTGAPTGPRSEKPCGLLSSPLPRQGPCADCAPSVSWSGPPQGFKRSPVSTWLLRRGSVGVSTGTSFCHTAHGSQPLSLSSWQHPALARTAPQPCPSWFLLGRHRAARLKPALVGREKFSPEKLARIAPL